MLNDVNTEFTVFGSRRHMLANHGQLTFNISEAIVTSSQAVKNSGAVLINAT